MPDVDHPKSRLNRSLGWLGRVIAHSINHRTWTHTIWAIIIVVILATIAPAPLINNKFLTFYGLRLDTLRLFYLGVADGYFLHVLEDSFSNLGVCWTYPLRKFNWYMGHPYKKGHRHFWNYRTGGTEEKVIYIISNLCLLIMLISMINKSI